MAFGQTLMVWNIKIKFVQNKIQTMLLNLILSKSPTQTQLQHIFNEFGFHCLFLQDDYSHFSHKKYTAHILNIQTTHDKYWQYELEMMINQEDIDEKWLYYSIAEKIAKITLCDVICCYYDSEIIHSDIIQNPYYDFAIIHQHWYLIDDVDADYANHHSTHGNIKIIKSIHKQMQYFLNFKHI